MIKVCTSSVITNFSNQVFPSWKSFQRLVFHSEYRHLLYWRGDLYPPMATSLRRFYSSIPRSCPLCGSISSSWVGITLPSFLHYGPVNLFVIYSTNVSVLYIHHYLPALYFAILLEGFVIDHFTRNLAPKSKWVVFAVFYVLVIATFYQFRDISFGMEGSASQWKHLNWLPKWRIADRENN